MEDGRDSGLTFWEHFEILRTYIFLGGGAFVLVALVCFSYFDDAIIRALVRPLNGDELLFLSPLGPFLFKVRVALYAALAVSTPLWLGLGLHFIAPALPRAKRLAMGLFVLCSILLGALSLAATYFYLVPVTLAVLRGFAVEGTRSYLTADSFLSFCLLEFLVAFIILQIPVATSALSYAGLLNPHALGRHRRLAILGIVIALAVITPTTDVVTLIVMSVPAVLLWEIGLAVSKLLYNGSMHPI